jgi:hypothetical protein
MQVGLVRIIQPMEDNHLMNLSLLILRIIRNKLIMKRRVGRKERLKEIA